MTTLGITTPVDYHEEMRFGALRHCKSFLSLNFHGHTAKVLSHENGIFYVDNKFNPSDSHGFTRLLISVAKVVAWFTLVLPLLAWMGAIIFHAFNPLVKGQPEDSAPLKQRIRQLELENGQIGQLKSD